LQHDMGWRGWQLHAASGLPLLCGAVGCLLGGVVTDRQVHVWGRRWGRTLQGVVACAAAGGLFLLAMRLTKSSPGLAFGALCLASFAKDLTMAASWATTIDIGLTGGPRCTSTRRCSSRPPSVGCSSTRAG
jgi:hypothetical protein